MSQTKIGLFCFTNDLRLHDQPALMRAVSSVDQLLCVYIFDDGYYSQGLRAKSRIGAHRLQFLKQSLTDLDGKLRGLGQRLLIVHGRPESELQSLIQQSGVQIVFRSTNAGWLENRVWSDLQLSQPQCNYCSIDSHTLFDHDRLPFPVADLPASFSKFRKALETIEPARPISAIKYLPPIPRLEVESRAVEFTTEAPGQSSVGTFQGGETAGLAHLKKLFENHQVANYKEVRNSLDGWQNSCKLSPWLANGSLSVREVVDRLKDYEQNVTRNESTYWVYFELLWREFFQWYAHKHGSNLFAFKGIKSQAPLTSFYAERFTKWVNGTTPYPIVNACMNELRNTGYLSNRGRQIVASCLVNELSVDWRYGAAYFEKMLIDYDVAANWGNWQYLAGVGADPRGKRHFDLTKQTQQFDAQGRYIKIWSGNSENTPLDSVDAADWPIYPED